MIIKNTTLGNVNRLWTGKTTNTNIPCALHATEIPKSIFRLQSRSNAGLSKHIIKDIQPTRAQAEEDRLFAKNSDENTTNVKISRSV